jgi:hypothetical protein
MKAPATVIRASADQQRAFKRAEAGAAGLPTKPLPGYTVASIWDGYDPPQYLVKRIAAPGELTVLFGQSGHLKSALAIDLALSVGLGKPFHGLKVRKAGVLYVAGEGHGGICKRLRAWLLAHGLDASSEQPAVYVTSAGADLIGDPEQLRATVESAGDALGVSVGLVIIDTLAANFGPGDENLVADMSLAIAGAREAAPSAALVFVHHTGHGQVERERGSYALVAAADYRLQAIYDQMGKILELRWLKCKDDEQPEPITFECRTVVLGWHDADGDELTSVVIDRLHGGGLQGPNMAKLGKHQDTALRALRTLYARARKAREADSRDPADTRVLLDGWRNECTRREIPRQRWADLVKDLQERRLIAIEGPHVILAQACQ